jgi:hypothetical protein
MSNPICSVIRFKFKLSLINESFILAVNSESQNCIHMPNNENKTFCGDHDVYIPTNVSFSMVKLARTIN